MREPNARGKIERKPNAMGKIERAKFLLVRGADDDQDFLDVGLDPTEGRAIQQALLADTEARLTNDKPESVFARITLEVEANIATLADYADKLHRGGQTQVAIGAVKAKHKIRTDWLKAGQDLGMIKRTGASGQTVNLNFMGDSALREVVGEKARKILALADNLGVTLDAIELPELGSSAPNMLAQTPSRRQIVDEAPVPASKVRVVNDQFPGD